MGKYRMYSIVLRQLDPIQKGIQSSHSAFEYARMYHKSTEFIHWLSVDKTLIILNGGTLGDLKECSSFLDNLGVPNAVFFEPDLGGIMTSISFLVDDKVWDTIEYPSFDDEVISESDSEEPDWLRRMGGKCNLELRLFLKSKRLA